MNYRYLKGTGIQLSQVTLGSSTFGDQLDQEGSFQILSAAQEMARRAGVAEDYTQVLFRSLGLCVITQLASDTCRDAGESAIASRVELAGRVAVLLCGLPLFQKLLELALALVSL